jgi:hypothetical protein
MPGGGGNVSGYSVQPAVGSGGVEFAAQPGCTPVSYQDAPPESAMLASSGGGDPVDPELPPELVPDEEVPPEVEPEAMPEEVPLPELAPVLPPEPAPDEDPAPEPDDDRPPEPPASLVPLTVPVVTSMPQAAAAARATDGAPSAIHRDPSLKRLACRLKNRTAPRASKVHARRRGACPREIPAMLRA